MKLTHTHTRAHTRAHTHTPTHTHKTHTIHTRYTHNTHIMFYGSADLESLCMWLLAGVRCWVWASYVMFRDCADLGSLCMWLLAGVRCWVWARMLSCCLMQKRMLRALPWPSSHTKGAMQQQSERCVFRVPVKLSVYV